MAKSNAQTLGEQVRELKWGQRSVDKVERSPWAGCCNPYAPHTPPKHCILWLELLSILPSDCRRIRTEDWNFVERLKDKSNLRESSMTGEERQVFEELNDVLQVEDLFPDTNRIKFN